MDQNVPRKSPWNSLEVSKLVVGILTPLSIFFFTYQVNQENYRKAQERERVVQTTKKRIELWSEIAPPMNELYCYFLYIGNWKDLAPSDIIKHKRDVDQLVYSNRPFFSSDFIASYEAFMHAAFRTGSSSADWGKDARLRTSPARPKDKGAEGMFERVGAKYAENREAIHDAYVAWLAFAAKEMDLVVPPMKAPEIALPGESKAE